MNTSVTSYKLVGYRNTKYKVDDYVATVDGYAKLLGVYQFNESEESVFCLIRSMEPCGTVPFIGYKLFSEATGVRKYIPFSYLRGKLHLQLVKDDNVLMIIYRSSAMFN